MMVSQHIFLGHASEDKPRVQALYHQLKGAGFSPWLDAEDLIPGQNWRVEIPKAIKSATIFLACLSKTSIAKRSYVQKEFRYALSAYADLPPDSIYLIPVRLDDCEVPDLRLAELELNLRDLHWVDLFDERGFERLVSAIELNVAPRTNQGQNTGSFAGVVGRDLEAFKSIGALSFPEMVMIPAGKFLMGSPKSEAGRRKNEGPQHEVTISKPYAIGRYAVTFDEYDHFCEAAGREKPVDRGWGRGRRPVIHVGHADALAYCAWLSDETGLLYQLPTEAQWEYACRAGTTTPFSFGNTITTDQVNYDGNHPYTGGAKGEYRRETVPIGSLPANAWGLHEMHGNVWEWCADWSGDYASAAVTDPLGPQYGAERVVRGGSWVGVARFVRAAIRNAIGPSERSHNLGFRCAGVQEES